MLNIKKKVHGGKANHHANENAKYFNPLDGMNVDVVECMKFC